MAARATWKGVLQISLVTIPIKVFPATESSESLSFHQLHETCQSRVTQRRWCLPCGREVPSAEIVKGFEFEKDKYVLLLPEELDAVQPLSTRVIDLVRFAPAEQLDPMYTDRTYYLAPDGPLAVAAYVVMRDAMNGFVGIGKLAIYGREYLVAVRPLNGVLVLSTLHHAAEIRSVDAIDDLTGLPARGPLAEYKLARPIFEALKGPLDLEDFTDAYQVDVRRLIEAKIAGQEIVEPVAYPTVPVLDLQSALTQSLAAIEATKTPPAKAKHAPKRKRAC